jgi:hypothetical protein
VARPVFKTGRPEQPSGWMVRFHRRLVERKTACARPPAQDRLRRRRSRSGRLIVGHGSRYAAQRAKGDGHGGWHPAVRRPRPDDSHPAEGSERDRDVEAREIQAPYAVPPMCAFQVLERLPVETCDQGATVGRRPSGWGRSLFDLSGSVSMRTSRQALRTLPATPSGLVAIGAPLRRAALRTRCRSLTPGEIPTRKAVDEAHPGPGKDQP